ncbi:hypothetical protein A4A49_11004 [Nicotiana attenuata]|uniref:Uncharacterized protein n=1 Tax=Nicotiana attenuata TaxID=49451 RepID=A0A1J6IWB9_NICAT|nr:hypothetical protein A4A49_11004 [Nicotiana attenuata]
MYVYSFLCRSRLNSKNMASTSAMANVFPETKQELTSRKTDRSKAIIDGSPNTSSGYDFLCKPNKGRCTVVEDKAIAAGIFFNNSFTMAHILGEDRPIIATGEQAGNAAGYKANAANDEGHEHLGFEALECAGVAASKSENMKFSSGANTGFFKSTVALKPTTVVHATGDQARQVLDFSGNSGVGQNTNGKGHSNVQNVTDGIPNMQGMQSNMQIVKEQDIGVEQQAKETEMGGMQAVQTDAQNNSTGNLDPNTRAAQLGATDVNKEMLAHVEKLSKVDGVTKITAGGDWIEVMRSPSRQGTSPVVKAKQQHLSVPGVQQNIITPNSFDALVDEEETGINSSIVDGTMVQQQIVSCTSSEKIVQGNKLMDKQAHSSNIQRINQNNNIN